MNKLYILCGIPFSGKTTLAKEIAKQKGFTRIDLDDVKFDLFGKYIQDKDLKQEDWDKIYQKNLAIYRRITGKKGEKSKRKSVFILAVFTALIFTVLNRISSMNLVLKDSNLALHDVALLSFSLLIVIFIGIKYTRKSIV